MDAKDRPSLSAYQPSKAEMEEVIEINGTPDQIAQAVLTGGAPRRESEKDGPDDVRQIVRGES